MYGAVCVKSLARRAAILSLFVGFVAFAGVSRTSAQSLMEGFDTVVSNDPMPLPGWVAINHSEGMGTTLWFQGNPTVFPSHQGATNSYIGANFNATTGASTINAWLLTPQRNLNNGDTITFYTRTVTGSNFPDRLQLRLSTAGASTNVGVGPNDVGDFMTLLLDINPTYVLHGYPEVWTQQMVTLSGLPAGASGRIAFRYYVEDGGPDGANSNYIGVDTFSFNAAAHPAAHQESDYDADGITDLSVVRNTGGGANGQLTWYNRRSTNGSLYAAPWGIASDFVAPGDYDGDNRTDIAVWRSGAPGVAAYYIFYTATATFSIYQFGQTGDNPDVHADFDGDGMTDPAVYGTRTDTGSQGFFFYRGSLNNPSGAVSYVRWGLNSDFPFTGDFDANGRADFGVQRNNGSGGGLFYLLFSNGTMSSFLFGNITDVVAPGDYDGDGRTDIALLRASGGNINWYVRPSSTGTISAAPYAVFGNAATDFPVQGDYDGDGRTDVAVWRESVDPTMNFFFWLGSTSGFRAAPWGLEGDVPAANWNTH